ncbi:MAG: helix-turn-helix domain-containing protein [Clostridia bacterium]
MNTNFPRTLSLLRKERKISQRAAAGELGVSQAVLSHYEKGVREPGLDFVARAADFYHVTTDFLLGRTMSRDDYTINAEEIPDSSDAKDNVMRGTSMLAIINKKLIVNSIGLLFDIIGRSKNKQLVNDVAMYFDLAVYRAFRTVYGTQGANHEDFFQTPEAAWSDASMAAMHLCEMRTRSALLDISLSGETPQAAALPELSQEILERDHPELLQSLLSLLQSVGKRLSELL